MIERLSRTCAARYPEWNLRNLVKIGQGLEAAIFRADTDRFGPVSIKVPFTRYVYDSIDEGTDTRKCLEQEQLLSHTLFPCPPPPFAFK